MATFSNNESNLSVRNKINAVLQHSDGTASELVINEAGADVDFRVESDTNANALFVDGATGNVGIGTGSIGGIFGKTFQVGDGSTLASINLPGTGALTTGDLYLSSGSDTASIVARGLTSLFFGTNETERMRIDADGDVGIGTNNPLVKLDIRGGNGIGVRYMETDTGNTNRIQLGTGNAFGYIDATAGVGDAALSLQVASTERMRIDASGNLGLGVTPSAWVANARALDISSFVSLWQQSNGATNLGFGVYEGAVNGFRYKSTGDAPTLYSQLNGAHRWFTAPSGTAGGAVSFTQAMTLDANGNLLIGTSTTGASKLRISGLPTSSAGLAAGDVWNDNGTLKIV